MTLNEIYDEWPRLTPERKVAALAVLFEYAMRGIKEGDEGLALALIEAGVDYEDTDYFGPEGLKV